MRQMIGCVLIAFVLMGCGFSETTIGKLEQKSSFDAENGSSGNSGGFSLPDIPIYGLGNLYCRKAVFDKTGSSCPCNTSESAEKKYKETCEANGQEWAGTCQCAGSSCVATCQDKKDIKTGGTDPKEVQEG